MIKTIKVGLSAIVLFLLLGFSDPLRSDVLIKNSQFTIHYSEILEQPTSVEYLVKCTETLFSRKGLDFYICDSIKTSDSEDYKNNEWDKGHMAPAADFSCDSSLLRSTFTYLNCALQHEKLNRGVWKELEIRERELAINNRVKVKIIIHFSKNSVKLKSGATIPDGFTKIIQYRKVKEQYYFPNSEPKFDSYLDYTMKP